MYDFSLDFVVGLNRKNIEYGKFKTDKVKIGKKLKELRNKLVDDSYIIDFAPDGDSYYAAIVSQPKIKVKVKTR